MAADETRSEYTVTLNGIEHTVMLTADEAEKAGATKSGEAKAEAKAADEHATKARAPRNK